MPLPSKMREDTKNTSKAKTIAETVRPRKKVKKSTRARAIGTVGAQREDDVHDVMQKAAEPGQRKKKANKAEGGPRVSVLTAVKEALVPSVACLKSAKTLQAAVDALVPAVGPKASAAVLQTILKKRKAATQASDAVNLPKKRQSLDDAALLGTEAYRKLHQIIVTGSCPAPLESFGAAEAGLGKVLTACLRQQGYTSPTAIQAQAWPILLRGQDLVGVAKTGSGKTCGFLLPALARLDLGKVVVPDKGQPALPRVLVLAPTRELAQQIAGEAAKFATVVGARVVALYGGVGKIEQLRELELGASIVVATPGRILDFSKGQPERHLPPTVSMRMVTYLVLDEADRMLDMGFEPAIRQIVAGCPSSNRRDDVSGELTRQTLFFTATWPKQVQRTAASFTSPNAVQVRIGQGDNGNKLSANTNVTQVVRVIDERQKLTHLKEILEKELASGESCFVFAKTRITCDYLEKKLWDEKEELSAGMWCRAIHSHREQWERDASLATFRAITTGKDNGRRGILVATDVAARGLDIPGVALVVVYDFGGGGLGEDSGVESYVHRIGRTGRAERKGKAFTFFTEHDQGARKLVALLDDAKQRVPYELRALAEKDRNRRGGGGSGVAGARKGQGGKGYSGGNGRRKGGGNGFQRRGAGSHGW